MSVDRFYCCGKLASVKLLYGAADNTESQPKSKKESCCRNEKQNFKIKDTHFNSSSFSLAHPVPVIVHHFTLIYSASASNLLYNSIAYQANAPPGHPDIPIYNLNCTYRI